MSLEQIRSQALTWPDKARGLAVQSNDAYDQAGEWLKAIKALRKEVDGAFDPIIAETNKAHRIAVAQKKQAEQPLAAAEAILKRSMQGWYDVEAKRLREEAAESERLAREVEEAHRLSVAVALETEGRATGNLALLSEAERVLEQPISVPPPPPMAGPAFNGVSHRENWDAVVDSKRALIVYIATHPEYDDLLEVNAMRARQLARSLRANLKVPGLRAVKQFSTAVRT